MVVQEILNYNVDQLEEAVFIKAKEIEVADNDVHEIFDVIETLREHHFETYTHSLRVGLLASSIGPLIGLRPKPLFYSGLFHDLGKLIVDPKVLDKEDFNQRDFENVKHHVLIGYKIIRAKHPFSANILVRHHQFGKDPYPKELPFEPIDFSAEELKEIDTFARFLAIIDFYDALMTREDDKFDPNKDKREIMLRENPDQHELIENLFNKGILV